MDLSKHHAEVARALRTHNYEHTGDGRVLIGNGMNVNVGGAFKHTLYRADGSIDSAMDPNLVVPEAINDVFNVYFHGTSRPAGFYVGLFKGNVTPSGTWTAANFDAQADEFAAYTGDRPAWSIGSGPTGAQAVGNSGSEAMFTFAAGGPYNIYGAAILTTAAKEGVTGKLIAATRFATPRLNQLAGDRLGVEYVLTGQDAG